MITHKQYVLASSSQSRQKILKDSGFIFKKAKPLCNEEEIKRKINKKKNATYIAKKLAYEKAKSVSKVKKFLNYYVIGCDTLIYINNKIYNKAKNKREAYNKIKTLSGKTHKIVTGLTICKNGNIVWQCSSTTSVKIRKLKPDEIKLYLKKAGNKILSSVGCYQIESLGPIIIEDIRGDFFNVMGLPLFKLLKYATKNK